MESEFYLDTNKINYLNIGLMVLSAILAYIYPFELFVFVYAVLGPLHYLTEISWLHDKNYYTVRKNDYILLLIAGVLVTVLNFGWIKAPAIASTLVTFMAFAAALVFAKVKKNSTRIFYITLSLIIAGFLYQNKFFPHIFGLLLPTLIHVFLFTGMFILVGALRGKSFSGMLSLGVFVLIALSFLFIHPAHPGYQVNEYIRNSFGYLKEDGSGFTDGFVGLQATLVDFYKIHNFGKPMVSFTEFVRTVNDYLYTHPVALALMSFIGFAYTYHYLNWFSKTSIIQWHRVPKSRFVMVILLWILSLAIYAYNYALGLDVLFFLSFTHVLLEFPLNQLTFIAIGKEIRNVFATR